MLTCPLAALVALIKMPFAPGPAFAILTLPDVPSVLLSVTVPTEVVNMFPVDALVKFVLPEILLEILLLPTILKLPLFNDI